MRFVLIHGTSHGAWCWERLIPELERLGHMAIAIDLPGHGTLAGEPADTFAARSSPINDVLQAGDVLVGHSAGGYDITIAADRTPEKIGHLIYLAAGLPVEGRSIGDAMYGVHDIDLDTGEPVRIEPDPEVMRHVGVNADGRMIWHHSDGPRGLFFSDCDDETVQWAFPRLTPMAPVPHDEIISVPNFWKADLPRSFILCTEDRTIPPGRARYACRRLGVKPIEMKASHSPFLSMPRELASVMVRAAGTKPIGPLSPN